MGRGRVVGRSVIRWKKDASDVLNAKESARIPVCNGFRLEKTRSRTSTRRVYDPPVMTPVVEITPADHQEATEFLVELARGEPQPRLRASLL